MLKIPARFKQCDLSVSLAFDYCDCIVNMGTRAAACKQLYTFYVVLHVFVNTVRSKIILVRGGLEINNDYLNFRTF